MPDLPHILVAEDEALAAMALEDFLSYKGFRVTVAYDGQEAMERLLQDRADALVTDLRMPRKDGQTLIREVRALDTRLPVVVMTGYLTPETGDNDLMQDRWKPLEVLRKPVSPVVILNTLQRMLGLPLTT
ncbi:response regulator [Azospirillum thermophilum]|uniref:Response regulator n=1 Tax=Azospirillum thermophilum TaxID=2202148 RepID=A0A2S2CRI4_9PROT|nr:response regulator [Azospirillum thermophilum]AWK87124.1 response regulator [Azospirillum thermophilum]